MVTIMKIIKKIVSITVNIYFKYFDYIGSIAMISLITSIVYTLKLRDIGSIIYVFCIIIWWKISDTLHLKVEISDFIFLILSSTYWIYVYKLLQNHTFQQIICKKILCL